jgi:hypothetical protein
MNQFIFLRRKGGSVAASPAQTTIMSMSKCFAVFLYDEAISQKGDVIHKVTSTQVLAKIVAQIQYLSRIYNTVFNTSRIECDTIF